MKLNLVKLPSQVKSFKLQAIQRIIQNVVIWRDIVVVVQHEQLMGTFCRASNSHLVHTLR